MKWHTISKFKKGIGQKYADFKKIVSEWRYVILP
jgi:hypothetical protein